MHGFCSCFGYKCFIFPFLQNFRYFTFRVIYVAEMNAFCGAYHRARCFQSIGHSMVAERTFINVPFGVPVTRIVGA